MTEAEAIEIMNFALGELLDLIQWWASISIGLIALTHFWEKRLNLAIVISLAIAYTLFTVYAVDNVLVFGTTMQAGFTQLTAMQDDGRLGPGGAVLLASPFTGSLPTAVWALCTFGVYLGALTFLTLTYRRNRTSS